MQAPSSNYRERILCYGGPGTGKTFDVLTIASWYQKTGTVGRFHILDSDNSLGRMLATDFGHLTNVEVEPVYEWTDYLSNTERVVKVMTPDDWLVIDFIGPAWDACQDYYVDQVFSKGSDEFFLEARKANAKGSALDGYKDWTVINKLYRKLPNTLLKARGHVYATSPADAINAAMEDKDVQNIFGHVGFKPRGQKHLGHTFHTCLYLMQDRKGWKVRTAKDRGREMLKGADIGDFVTSYLMPVAGWKL